jgi:8-oxo-dGTP pyrophosphatase MutT (NUDIX family)
VATDLDFFRVIVPCGISDRGVTSLSQVLERNVSLAEVRGKLTRRFSEVFDREVISRDVTSHSVQVLIWRRTRGACEILLLKRTPPHGGFWQPVTGMIERDESASAASVREVREETGIEKTEQDVVDLRYVRDFRISREYIRGAGPHPWINREHAFALEADEPKIRLSPAEHEEYLWTTPRRARELFKWNGNKKALDRLERLIGR